MITIKAVLWITLAAFVVGFLAFPFLMPLEHFIERTPVSEPVTEIQRRDVDKELIRMDICDVGSVIGLSKRQQEDYIRYVDSASVRYKVPAILLHSISSIESSYDPTAVHPLIRVNGKETRALGLTGVVWEYHSKTLQSEGIASSRLELTEPAVNLMASACILRNMIVQIVGDYSVKSQTLTDSKLFDELVRRYYGAYDESYKQKMLLRIKDTAGKQWMRRVAQDILTAFPPIVIQKEVPNAAIHEGRTNVAGHRVDSLGSHRL
jgi:hypothetical protein